MKLNALILMFILLIFLSRAQAPGGISAGLQTWVKANAGVTGSNPVTAWANQVATGTAVVVNGSPTLNTTSASYNYNPYIDFTGPSSPRQFLSLSGFNGNSGINYRAVFLTAHLSDLSRVNSHIATTESITVSAPVNGTFHGTTNGGLAGLQEPSYDSDFELAGTWRQNATAVTFSAGHLGFKNIVSAVSQNNNVSTINRFLGGQTDFGGTFFGNIRDWRGPVGELIAYTTSLSATSRQRVESYLAVKYGVTLSTDYVNTSGATIYTTTGSYTANIIGIGRDDAEVLVQKQSHNNNDTVRVYLSTLAVSNTANTGSFSSNLSYVVVGANTGKMCAAASTTAELPASCGLVARIEREWKVTNTNFNQTFNMDFKLNSCALTGSVTASSLRLLVDDDGNFSNGGTTCYFTGDLSGIGISYSNPVITITNLGTVHIPSGTTRFITIAANNVNTPLPIELSTFTANCVEDGIQLNWQTLSEKNSSIFDIQRSNDGINYESLALISTNGTSNRQHDYSYLDKAINSNINYYRLLNKDTDQSESFSPIILVNCVQTLKPYFAVFPNPASGSATNLNYRVHKKEMVNIEITDVLGHKFPVSRLALDPDKSLEPLETGNLTEGFYEIKITGSESGTHLLKFIKY